MSVVKITVIWGLKRLTSAVCTASLPCEHGKLEER